MSYVVKTNTADVLTILTHWEHCSFNPNLSEYIDINSLALKIVNNAVMYEIWDEFGLIALAAVYQNRKPFSYLTILSVVNRMKKKGVAGFLMDHIVKKLYNHGYTTMELEVFNHNMAAKRLYEKLGFYVKQEKEDNMSAMTLDIYNYAMNND